MGCPTPLPASRDVGWFSVVCLERPLNNETYRVPRQYRLPNSRQADSTSAPEKELNLRKWTRTLQSVRRGRHQRARQGRAFYPAWRESTHFVSPKELGDSAPRVSGGNVLSEPDQLAVAECRPMNQTFRFDSQSGHIPPLGAQRSLAGIFRGRLIDDALSSWMFLSPPSPL